METGSSAEVVDVAMASVDGSIRRDDDYIEGVLFSDGSTRAELDECAVSLGLDPGDYEDKFHLRRALSSKLTQQSINDRLAAATQHSEDTVTADRPRMCCPTCQQLPWCPAHGHTSNVASPTKKPIVIVADDAKKIQTTKKTRGVIWWRKV